jgi:hypothetical protein
MPYATKAIISHEFDIDHLNIYIEFRHPMDITVKPSDDLWIVNLDSVPTAITSSTWLDQFTMLLLINGVGSLPDRVTVQYDGPDPLLITAWDKQWNPWAAIPSYSGWPTTFKYGMIILWHGSIATIPSGWHLCNGTEGTPDLRDRFIIGAGSTYTPADAGGTLEHTHAATMGATPTSLPIGTQVQTGSGLSKSTSAHTHNFNVPNTNHLPPYYALAYIMKL